ncbi:hypothetical protein [Streptomyces spiramyceticus]|uniref:hypothetical protein n=1 Tax=Streptomyces spiramyceticus TaxID=299717 RepID=UPI00237B97D4|nr:hypothetical protein [Streptomyces spiramyceticus]
MRVSPALPIVILLVGLTACTSEESPRPPAGDTPSARPTAPTATKPAAGRSFNLTSEIGTDTARSASAGRQYDPRYAPKANLGAGLTTNILDITASGRLVAAANSEPKSTDGVVRIGQSRVGLQDATSFSPFPAAKNGTCRNTPRQAVYADERDGTVAWVESASTNLYAFDWCVFAYDPGTKTTTLLGDSASVSGRQQGMPEPSGSSAVSLGQSKAFWATTYQTSGKPKFGVKVVARQLTGGSGLETAVDHAKLPRAVGDTLFYVRSADIAPGFPKDRFEIRKREANGTDRLVAGGPLTAGQEVSTLSVKSSRVNWVIANPEQANSRLYSLDLKTNNAVTFKLGHAGPSTMFLRSTDDHLVWGNGSAAGDAGQYVYEFESGKLWRVGAEEGFSVIYAKADRLAWANIPGNSHNAKASYEVADWK